MTKIFNKKIIKEIKYRGFSICFTEKEIWVLGFEGFPPQWAESLNDAKELINFHLGG